MGGRLAVHSKPGEGTRMTLRVPLTLTIIPALTVGLIDVRSVNRDYWQFALTGRYGVSPRGPISLVQAARSLAVVRGRDYALVEDVQALTKDALRHRLVLTYQALAEGVSADSILEVVFRVLDSNEPFSITGTFDAALFRSAWL